MTGSATTPGLAYQLAGEGSRRTLLVHGLGGDRSQPLALVDDELATDGHFVAPDLRGHGDTRLPMRAADLTFATLARDVVELLQALPPAPEITLVGISLGAAVACQLLAAHWLPVRRMVLIRPAWGWTPHPDNLAVYPRIADLLESLGPVEALGEFTSGPDYAAIAAVSAAAARALHGQFTAPGAAGRAERLRALPASAPACPAATDLPILVIGSDRDPVHPLPLAAQIAREFGAELRRVPPRYDEPAAHQADVRAALKEFLSRS